MSGENDPKTFLSKKVADGDKDPEQITNLESKEQREFYRFLTVYSVMGFDFLTKLRDYEQRMNMSKDKMRSEQLTEMIVGIEKSDERKAGAKELAEELKKDRK
jgi:hypothetical protein